MYKRKYGKMTVNAWLNSELERTNCFVAVFLGVLLTVAAIFVRISVGSPYRTILELGIGSIIPPVWLMMLIWTMAFFVNGCAAGLAFTYRIGGCELDKYKGALSFFLLAAAELLWYPILFGKQFVLISVFMSILILCLAIATTTTFYRITKFSGMLLFFHDVWLIYMLILNFAVLARS
ncbi:MAG: tryptophan-rich sensory protein [Ruminococcaceae bacterium]|nr:tryptophan-rich sensory protein [Oscillospiraceae bacterium]